MYYAKLMTRSEQNDLTSYFDEDKDLPSHYRNMRTRYHFWAKALCDLEFPSPPGPPVKLTPHEVKGLLADRIYEYDWKLKRHFRRKGMPLGDQVTVPMMCKLFAANILSYEPVRV